MKLSTPHYDLAVVLRCLFMIGAFALMPQYSVYATVSQLSIAAPASVPSAPKALSPPIGKETPSDAHNKQQSLRNAGTVVLTAILTMLILIGGWFVWTFTRPMSPGLVAPQAEITPLVVFCYVFTFLAFSVVALPVFLVHLLPPSAYDATYAIMARSPVGILKGCVRDAASNDWELSCGKTSPWSKAQWVVNIGGSASSYQNQENTAPGEKDPKPTSDVSNFKPMTVNGGLVVPWYFVTLAVVGAAVSLARRVPEYQRKAISSVDSLNGPACRELLEFQILQVLCAPFVAITAYNIVLPSSLAVGATLGFASGFSSEAVLLGIRAALEPIMTYLHKTIVASTKSEELNNDEIVAAVVAALSRDQELMNSQIQVSIPRGAIELTGTVDSPKLSAKAAKLAQQVKDVAYVSNSLTTNQHSSSRH